jgi:hypothetical protein
MISVFNGRARSLGRGNKDEVYMQVTVSLREHLHLFKGARLAVFMAIALHSDSRGWSHPSVRLMTEETGLDKNTIFRALNDLCTLEIDGMRVLLRDSGKGRKNSSGTHVTNRYLIFPSETDIAEHETPAPELPFDGVPMSQNADTAMSQNADTAMSQNADTEVEPFLTRTSLNKNQVEEKPP